VARLRLFASLGLLIGVLAVPSSAAAQDTTMTAVQCLPASRATGTATTCTATVTDSDTPTSTPGGEVSFSASPDSGTFPSPSACTLDASGQCPLSFTPATGGVYTITASYAGDADHAGSTGTGSVTAVDPTTTSLSCTPATVQIGSSTQCTATLSDPTATQPPIGNINFSSSPTTGTFGASGVCPWQPSKSGVGGSATCAVTFTPTTAGPYTLTAGYVGDNTHGPSSGSFRLTATMTPAGGGPGSHGGGGGTLTIVISSGPPAPGKVTIAPSAKVSRGHAAALALSCAGASGSSCVGALTFTRRAKVKVKVHVKTNHHSKKGHKRHKTRIKIETKSTTIVIGSLTYSLATRHSQAFTFKLSKAAVKLLTKARAGRLKVQVWSAGVIVKTVTLQGPKHKKHKKHKRHRKHKRHKKK
jgi:Bacterial Ig-like domain (group 3)